MKFQTVEYRITSAEIKQTKDSSGTVWFLDAVQTCDLLPGLHSKNIVSGTKEHCEKAKALLVANE